MLTPHATAEIKEPRRLPQLATDIDHKSALFLIWDGFLAKPGPPLNLLAVPDVSRLPCSRLRRESKLKRNFLARNCLSIYVNGKVLIKDEQPSSETPLEFVFINCAGDLKL